MGVISRIVLYRVLFHYFDRFLTKYESRFEKQHGFLRPIPSKGWAEMIRKVYEVDPMVYPRCGSEMALVVFIDPPQGEVIERILRHCGLWRGSGPRPPPDVAGVVHDLDGCFSDRQPGSCDQAGELTFVDMATFEATF